MKNIEDYYPLRMSAFLPRYCTLCGKELEVTHERAPFKYDPFTGDPRYRCWISCPDYKPLSPWQFFIGKSEHDMISTTIEIIGGDIAYVKSSTGDTNKDNK